jgi:hypothetical protein
MKKKKLSIVAILPRIAALINNRELTIFLENAELLGYERDAALSLLAYLQTTGVEE